MGRGTPVPAKVLLCSRGVKNAVLVGDKHGDQRSEVGGQKTARRRGDGERRRRGEAEVSGVRGGVHWVSRLRLMASACQGGQMTESGAQGSEVRG